MPDDISVIGYDNLPVCSFCTPKLTTISQDIELKAKKAGDLLFSIMGDKEEKTVFEKIAVKLEERESVKRIVSQ